MLIYHSCYSNYFCPSKLIRFQGGVLLTIHRFQRVMHSVLTARIVLHLRAAAAESESGTKSGTVTSILFNPATHPKQRATIESGDTELEDFHLDIGTSVDDSSHSGTRVETSSMP